MADNQDLNVITTKLFILHCKHKFGWNDLSNDVIMDLGCGVEGHCGKSILERFPEAGAVIGIDGEQRIAREFRLKNKTKMECDVANLMDRQTLKHYEGKMSKVISTHVLHQIKEKEEALRNVYYLLQPGGEAAFLFVIRSYIHEWMTELLANPKWKGFHQGHFNEDMYNIGFGAAQYKEMVEKIGFQVVECSAENREIPYPSDEACKDGLYEMCRNAFKVPPETLEEFKQDCFQVLLKLCGRNGEGQVCYRSIDLYLLLVKPAEASMTK